MYFFICLYTFIMHTIITCGETQSLDKDLILTRNIHTPITILECDGKTAILYSHQNKYFFRYELQPEYITYFSSHIFPSKSDTVFAHYTGLLDIKNNSVIYRNGSLCNLLLSPIKP